MSIRLYAYPQHQMPKNTTEAGYSDHLLIYIYIGFTSQLEAHLEQILQFGYDLKQSKPFPDYPESRLPCFR